VKFNSKLHIKKQSAIVDFLAKQPTILSRECVRENVLSGYVTAGFVDPIHFHMPVLLKIMGTCKNVCHFSVYNNYLSKFGSLMVLSYNNGNQYLSGHDFISHGFHADIDAYGNEKIRDATISQENQQRAKCLTSVVEVFTRANRLEEIDLVTRKKEQLVKAKMNQKLMEDKTLIAKLCAMMNLEPSEDNNGQCELKHFDKLKAVVLKALIIARHPKYMMLSDVGHLKNPRGGKSMEEASNGVENCISVAFGVRNEKRRLFEINKTLNVAVAVTVPVTSRIHLSGLNCVEIKPSDIMKNHAKVELLFFIFDVNSKLSFSEWHDATADANMFAEVLKKADLLFVMLSSRFQNHVKRKV